MILSFDTIKDIVLSDKVIIRFHYQIYSPLLNPWAIDITINKFNGFNHFSLILNWYHGCSGR
jgi:hypothetical protein